ncbi:MAG: hypothetical protein RI957_1700 [Verrucomicrobiota bacterium]|jgi:hypothetical protein
MGVSLSTAEKFPSNAFARGGRNERMQMIRSKAERQWMVRKITGIMLEILSASQKLLFAFPRVVL